MAVGDQSRLLGIGGVHHSADVLHPVLRGDRMLDHSVGEADTAHVEPEHARVAVQRCDELLNEWLFPNGFEVTRPIEHEDDVALPLPDRLVGEVDVAAFRIAGPGPRHAPFVSQGTYPS